MNRTVRFCLVTSLALAGFAGRADVPWKFEGSTNRVAVASAASAATTGFVAHEVSLAVAPTWPDLVRHEFTEALSPFSVFFVQIGNYLILK